MPVKDFRLDTLGTAPTIPGQLTQTMTTPTPGKTRKAPRGATRGKDTGSADVQVRLLTGHITQLSGHTKAHPKDHASRRGLIQMVNQRASLLKYLLRTAPKRHAAILGELGLRK